MGELIQFPPRNSRDYAAVARKLRAKAADKAVHPAERIALIGKAQQLEERAGQWYRQWAAHARQVMGWATDGENDPLIDSEFRRWAHLPPRTASQLRRQAREQCTCRKPATKGNPQ